MIPGGRILGIKLTLQVNILIAFVSLLIATVLIIVTYTYQQNSKAVLALADSLIEQVTLNVQQRTTSYLTPAVHMAKIGAHLPEVETTMLLKNPDLEQYGTEVIKQYPQLSGFFIGNEEGDFIFTKRDQKDGSVDVQVIDRTIEIPTRTWTYRDPNEQIESIETTTEFSYDPRQRPWYIGAKRSGMQFWTDIYIFFTDKKPGITSAYPIYNDLSELIGVIGIDVALDELSQFLKTQQVGRNGISFIINEKAEVVAFPGIELAAEENEKYRPIQLQELNKPWITASYEAFLQHGQGQFNFKFGIEDFIASYTAFPAGKNNQWQIAVVVPRNDFVGTINQTNRITLLMSFLILAFALLFAIVLSRSISRPIVLLTQETDKIKSFDLDSEIEVRSSIHEVKALSESISAMRSSLRAFKTYVPSDLVRQLISSGEDVQLGGTKKELTILFTDVVGFTSLTEQMVPEELMLQLSNYLGELASEIMNNNGTVDKFLGDGVMGFWGAPQEIADHAERACRTALAIIKASEQSYGNSPSDIFPTRIGIHTGETLVGNMGSKQRMEYTVVGDSVNLTSRLERANKVYGTHIIVSQTTFEQTRKQFIYRPLDQVIVKGKHEFVLLYELLGEKTAEYSQLQDLVDRFSHAYIRYTARDWSTAQRLFESVLNDFPNDIPSAIYIERCIELQQNPPGPDWQPVTHLIN